MESNASASYSRNIAQNKPWSPTSPLSLHSTLSSTFTVTEKKPSKGLASSFVSSPLYQEKSVSIKVPEESTAQGPTQPGISSGTQIFEGILTIVNMEFSADLSKLSSEAFKTLEDDLTKLLNEIFQSITGFLYTKVDSFEKGSIVCKFSIFTKAESSSAENYKTALVAASKDGNTGEFKMDKIEVKDTVTDESVGSFKGEITI